MSGKTSETRCKHCQREIELDLSSGFWTAWGDVTCPVLPHIHAPTPPEGEAAPEYEDKFCVFCGETDHLEGGHRQIPGPYAVPKYCRYCGVQIQHTVGGAISFGKHKEDCPRKPIPAPVVSTAAPAPPSMQEINLPWTVSGDSPANPPMVWDASGDSIVNQMPDGKPYFEPEVAAFIGHAANSLAAHETESATLQGKLSALVILLRARCSDKEWDAMPETLAEVLPAEIATLRKERDEAEKAIAKALRFTPSEEDPEEGAPWMVEAEPEPMGPFSLIEAITAMMKMYDGEFSKADKRAEAAEAQLSTLREALEAIRIALKEPTGGEYWTARKFLDERGIYNDDLDDLRVLNKVAVAALAPTPEWLRLNVFMR